MRISKIVCKAWNNSTRNGSLIDSLVHLCGFNISETYCGKRMDTVPGWMSQKIAGYTGNRPVCQKCEEIQKIRNRRKQ